MLSDSIARTAAAIGRRLAAGQPFEPIEVELLLALLDQWQSDAAALEQHGRPAAPPARLAAGPNVVPFPSSRRS